MAATERQFSGAVLRADLAWINEQKLTAQVRERVPAETQALMDKPPLPISWIAARHIDALLTAVGALGGDEQVTKIGLDTTRSSFGPVLKPLLRTLMALFGSKPSALLRKLDTFLPTFLRGVSFEWNEAGERAGALHLRAVDTPAPAFLQTWRGTLLFVFEVAGTSGRLDRFTPDADGRGAIYELSWD